MTKATRDEYDRTVQLAEAAIKGHKKLALKLKKQSAEALMAAVQEKAARGEAATVAEIGAWASATATQNTPKRGRGRPTVDMAARGAFGAAYIATVGSGLTNYRNSASGHRMTRCDALVEAMQAAGYTSLTTYDAAAAELGSIWRSFECTTEAANAARRSEDSLSRRGKLAGRIRGTMTIQLSPKTIDKPKRAAKTKR